jgi:hypothetical protein
MRTLIRVLCLCAVILWATPAASAQEATAGVVKSVKGTATALRADRSIALYQGVTLYPGDRLRTGKASALGVILQDDTLVSLGPETEWVLEAFHFAPAEGKLSFISRLLRGTAVFLTGVIGKLSPESVRLETPHATVGIRGTRFAVAVEGNEP